ncbi:hypothetical protein ABHN11_23990 [Brevibacillus centrosporus]|nr:hypothetical protein BCE02nite_25820 [Brevibacillus centrosporus]
MKELEVSGLDREQLCSLAELASLEKLTLVGLLLELKRRWKC